MTTFQIKNIPTVLEVNAWDNIQSAWIKLMKSEPSIVQTEHCSGICACNQRKELGSISPNWNTINTDGFNALEKALKLVYGIRSIPCSTFKCGGRRTIGCLQSVFGN